MSKTIILSEAKFAKSIQTLQDKHKQSEDVYLRAKEKGGDLETNIAIECYELLKQSNDTLDEKHQFIHLDNGCKFRVTQEDIQNGDLSFYEIWMPDGEGFDGYGFPEDLDIAIQEELANHIIWPTNE